jgi:hypothetical protein
MFGQNKYFFVITKKPLFFVYALGVIFFRLILVLQSTGSSRGRCSDCAPLTFRWLAFQSFTPHNTMCFAMRVGLPSGTGWGTDQRHQKHIETGANNKQL